MGSYVITGRQTKTLTAGDPFKPDGFSVTLRVTESVEGEEAAVVQTSLKADDAETILEAMRKRGAIDTWREELVGWKPAGLVYPTGDEGTIREHFPTVGVPKDSLMDMTIGIADTGTPPVDAQNGPLSEYEISDLDHSVDQVGHATAVASCTFAKYLLFAQALPQGTGSESSIARAIRMLADARAKVINLSLGWPGQNPPRSEIIAAAIRYAQSKGCLVGAAAGNSGWTAGYGSPQAESDFVWGASTLDGSAPASFTSGGSNWEIETGAVPGKDVGVAHLDGGYGLADGTSFAAPLGNSLVCAMYEHNAWSKETIKNYCQLHMVAYTPPRRRGLVVVDARDMGLAGEQPPPQGDWLTQVDGIISEVWRLANDAQRESEQGNLWAGVNALGPVKVYMEQIGALLPKAEPVPVPEPIPAPEQEDWAGLLSGAQGLAGKVKWYSGPNANGIDIFVKRGTVVKLPFAGALRFDRVSGGPMLIGQVTLTHKDGRTVRYRHVELVGAGFDTIIVQDPSMDILRWPPGYPVPPDGYQHLDLSLASHPSLMDPTGGAGGNVNAYAHIWGKKGGIPGIRIIDRTPGPPEGMAGHTNSWSP